MVKKIPKPSLGLKNQANWMNFPTQLDSTQFNATGERGGLCQNLWYEPEKMEIEGDLTLKSALNAVHFAYHAKFSMPPNNRWLFDGMSTYFIRAYQLSAKCWLHLNLG